MFVQSIPVLPHKSSSCHTTSLCRCTTTKHHLRACSVALVEPLQTEANGPNLKSTNLEPSALFSNHQGNRDPEVEALNILEWAQLSEHVSRLGRTPAGRMLMRNGVDGGGLEIGRNRKRSEELLQETREMIRLVYELGRDLPLRGAEEVRGIARDAQKGRTLSGRELRDVASTLAAGRSTRRALEAVGTSHGGVDRLLEHARSARTWPEVENDIITKIDELGDVTDMGDAKLAAARAERREVVAKIRETLRNLMVRHPDAIQDRIVTQRYDRFVLAVKAGKKGLFRGATTHDVSTTGNTAYIEPAQIRASNDRLHAITAIEKTRVRAVLTKLTESIAPIAEDIVTLCEGLSAIDAAGARADISIRLNAVDVKFADSDASKIGLRSVRHPLLALNAQSRAKTDDPKDLWKKEIVPQDFLVPEGVRCVCITGTFAFHARVILLTV